MTDRWLYKTYLSLFKTQESWVRGKQYSFSESYLFMILYQLCPFSCKWYMFILLTGCKTFCFVYMSHFLFLFFFMMAIKAVLIAYLLCYIKHWYVSVFVICWFLGLWLNTIVEWLGHMVDLLSLLFFFFIIATCIHTCIIYIYI